MDYLIFQKKGNFAEDIFENLMDKNFFSTFEMPISYKSFDKLIVTQYNHSRVFIEIFTG